MKLLSCVRLLVTPWTAAYQAPPSMGFSRQVYWSRVPLPSLLVHPKTLEFCIFLFFIQLWWHHSCFHILECHSWVSCFCSITKSCPTLQSRELQYARLPCPLPSRRVCSDSYPLSQWRHPTISSSVTPSLLALNLSQNQRLFQWVGSSHQVAKVLELQLQH